ncbi:MAG: hypothetical protein AB1782_10265 [Cyanobacteriota bacterium]
MIKKLLIVLFLGILFFTNNKIIQAQSMHELDYNFGSEGGAEYWSEGYNDASAYTADTNDMDVPDDPKMVSDKEFEDALASYEKYGFSYKQRKEIQRQRAERLKKEATVKPDPLKPTPYALLRLPVSILAGNKILYPGYYLLKCSVENDNKFIIFQQGNNDIASIEVAETLKQDQKIDESFIEMDFIDEDNLSILLNTRFSKIKLLVPIKK